MKKTLLISFISALLVMNGCNSEKFPVNDSLTSDFTPPEDFEWGWENDGPYEMRLLSARSEDGITWERDNAIITNQGNTPNLAIDDEGTIYLYYTGGNMGDKKQGLAVAISHDDGATWIYKIITIDELPLAGDPGDPDTVILEDGTFRLYFTSGPQGSTLPGIYYADSADGIHFTYGGEAFRPEAMAIDSSTYYWDGAWRMFTFTGFDRAHLFAESATGDAFTFIERINLGEEGLPNYFLANEFIDEQGTLRAYGFDLSKNGEIRSATSEDGIHWTDEGIAHLALDTSTGLEGYYLKDPAVAQLADGTYFMVYVTRVIQE